MNDRQRRFTSLALGEIMRSRVNMRIGKCVLALVGVALIAATGCATVASAQDQRTPKSWSDDITDGKRVPKGNRVTNADGRWTEEVRRDKCATSKEKSASGEYK